jgi:L-histidine Nalpha-methyltransferase / hercynylcysteine S-oxide synthase
VPTLEEFECVFKAWDCLIGSMIQGDRLLTKPIALRHPYLFYHGHLPAFIDIQLSKCLDQELTSPAYFAEIFERGIDPNVEDPTIVHAHSKVPDVWPSLSEISEYRDKVRDRLRKVYEMHKTSKRLARGLFMCYHHESMHLETMLYMVVQDEHHLAPSMFPVPNLKDMTGVAVPACEWVESKGGVFDMGIDDPEDADFLAGPLPTALGWDNEKGKHTVAVEPFSIQHRPVTIAEYLVFLEQNDASLTPSSWKANGNSYDLKTVFGLIPITKCLHFPVYASGHQAKAYADSLGLQLPSEQQLKLLFKSNPPEKDDNFGFKNLLPQNVKGYMGKVNEFTGNGWELTQTVFDKYPGFQISSLYPGYSADFLYIHLT